MAQRPKFHFNPDLLRYERIDNSFKTRAKKFLIHLLSGSLSGLIFFLIFTFFFQSPREKEASDHNRQLESQYKVLNKRFDQMQAALIDLQQRDDNLYRVIYQMEPMPYEARHGGYQTTDRYRELLEMSNSKIIKSTAFRAEELAKQLYAQSKSYDEIVSLIKQNEERMQSIPAIQPILNKDLSRTASGYGMRIDPIYGTPKFHAGMDFSAPVGTDIFATGKGVVEFAGQKEGYGNCIIINHGFGYETLYGHLSKIKVHEGQKVTRGDIIGFVGSTGKSTGSHLHYEVLLRGKNMNPQNYYFMDLSPEEYDLMVQRSANHGQIFD